MNKQAFWEAFMKKMAIFGFGESAPPPPPPPAPSLGNVATQGGTKTINQAIGNPFG